MQINMDYIQAQLQRRAGERQLATIARALNINVRTLQRLAKGQSGTVKNAQAVQQFLHDTERQRRLDRVEVMQ